MQTEKPENNSLKKMYLKHSVYMIGEFFKKKYCNVFYA